MFLNAHTLNTRVNILKSSSKAAHASSRVARQQVLVKSVADFVDVGRVAGREAIVCKKFQAHEAAISQALVLEDSEHRKQIISSSLDKSVALWVTEGNCEDLCQDGYQEAVRLSPPGGPVFSMLYDHRSDDGLPNQVYLGNHAKQIVAWVPPLQQLESGIALEDHSGWVRSLATAGGRWLFSAACNQIKQWDMARAVPSAVASVSVEKGDILALAATKDRLFTAGADGSIRGFDISKKGELTASGEIPKAHQDRVTAITLCDGLLFSASYDGSLKAWDATTLEPALSIENAHNGERVHCLVVGPGGLLYSGGSDKLVRRWWPEVLLEAAVPLFCHNHSVRALAAGANEIVVSADKGGEIAVWRVM